MFENILHAPLQLGSGASQAARSLLEGLLERDVTKRLGGSYDLVSAHIKNVMMQMNTSKHRGSNFSVYAGGAAGTSLLCIDQLGRPPGQKSQTAVHPKSGRSDSETCGEHYDF